MLAIEHRTLGDSQDLHFGKSKTQAILLERVNSRMWGRRDSYRTWLNSNDWVMVNASIGWPDEIRTAFSKRMITTHVAGIGESRRVLDF